MENEGHLFILFSNVQKVSVLRYPKNLKIIIRDRHVQILILAPAPHLLLGPGVSGRMGWGGALNYVQDKKEEY